ncbi:hypothetical protein [Bacillus coahuilensis]|uniref:hypothetical protein n=1 Tax=Bacillus coahuilensis TaxID=408580 RepID=UPI0009E970AE|nr:hypothetical protein [Bacillus coahuilensis]
MNSIIELVTKDIKKKNLLMYSLLMAIATMGAVYTLIGGEVARTMIYGFQLMIATVAYVLLTKVWKKYSAFPYVSILIFLGSVFYGILMFGGSVHYLAIVYFITVYVAIPFKKEFFYGVSFGIHRSMD